MTTNALIKNKGLQALVKSLKIDKDQESFLLEKIPQMDKEERVSLFKTLMEVHLLNMEEKESLERLRKLWQS